MSSEKNSENSDGAVSYASKLQREFGSPKIERPTSMDDEWKVGLTPDKILEYDCHLRALRAEIIMRPRLEPELIRSILQAKNKQDIKELVIHIINYRTDAKKIMQLVFQEMVVMKVDDSSWMVEVLKILLDHGMGIDDFIDGTDSTPLHLSVIHKKIDFVSVAPLTL